jgi:hypothetical protein
MTSAGSGVLRDALFIAIEKTIGPLQLKGRLNQKKVKGKRNSVIQEKLLA